MHAVDDKAANLAVATRLVEEAAGDGARLVVLPELFNYLGPLERVAAHAEAIPGPTSESMSRLAARLGVHLVAGSIAERAADADKAYNTSLIFDTDGNELARYRKLHLFDVDLPGEVTNRESQWIAPGNQIAATSTSLGTIGQAICYDLRFPELFRRLVDRGTKILAFPSAFSAPTGRAHWDVLIRARAIENQIYVIAADQYGRHTPQFASYGHSAIIDPWGKILASHDEGDAVISAEIDLEQLAEIRRALPALTHRRALDQLP